MRQLLLLIIGIMATATASAQIANATMTPPQASPQYKPRMMVIPFTKQGEDIRTVLEEDVNKRIALTKVKEAFDHRGYTMVDFFARLKALSTASGLGTDQQQDHKTLIIQGSGADIYVEAEIDILQSATGNAVKVILTAYDISTGNSLANTIGESGRFYTDDYGKLAARAVEKGMDGFLNVIQSKFYDIVENGRSISVTIGVADGSQWLMSTELGAEGMILSDRLEIWMEENAYKGNYHIQGTTDRQMIFDDVRIPLKDENGRTYNINKFALKLAKLFSQMGIRIERSISTGTLVVTLK